MQQAFNDLPGVCIMPFGCEASWCVPAVYQGAAIIVAGVVGGSVRTAGPTCKHSGVKAPPD